MATTEAAAVEDTVVVAEGVLLLFELENVALGGRKKLFELLKKNLPALGVQLNQGIFSRLGLKPTPEQSVAAIAEGSDSGKGDAAKVGGDVNAAYVAEMRNKAEGNPHVVKLLEGAAKKGFHLGALSAMTQEDAEVALKRLGLKGNVALYAHKPDDAAFPRAEGWLKLVKAITKNDLPAVAIVSSQAACKSALSAGLRVVVVPDEFTSFQDFGGADIVVDSASELDVADILATLAID